MTGRPWISRPFLAAALALTVLFVLLLTAVTRLAVNENRLSGEPAEGVIWFSSQGQYEAMRLADAVLLFEAGRVPLDEVVLRYDLLDSRVRLFEEGQMTVRVAAMGYDDEVADMRAMLDAHRADLASLRSLAAMARSASARKRSSTRRRRSASISRSTSASTATMKAPSTPSPT